MKVAFASLIRVGLAIVVGLVAVLLIVCGPIVYLLGLDDEELNAGPTSARQ
ncbi:hypothetical protein Tcur_4150 [Thermomonospora curvata DSM 43183]|uniref:Uncharacterized protein n=1 Tax=Thermomonospora curvata (strain ATCC 19995 / DSM 43183 / JCM 3096 / KCTC 9072 / NBRC 15933 / NCIMB 10081 / Henssen B9) TaxID=471852 RepID=D1A225_THECD|nr:hypothetical protein Tcur_4150 [Thermomonospora curvata DSM 43183]